MNCFLMKSIKAMMRFLSDVFGDRQRPYCAAGRMAVNLDFKLPGYKKHARTFPPITIKLSGVR